MIETKNKVIGGHDYAVTQFPARRGISMLARLLKIAGVGLTPLLKGGMNAQIDFAPILANLTERLDEDAVVKYIEDLLQCTRRDGVELTPAIIDSEFTGKYLELFKAVGFVMEVNFSSFFDSTAAKDLTEKAKTVKVIRTS